MFLVTNSVCAQSAISGLDEYFPAGTDFCYGRIYDALHLRKNLKQTVTALFLAGITLDHVSELVFKGAGDREAVGPADFSGSRHQCDIGGLCCAVDDKRRTGQRLERRRDRAIGAEVLSPGRATTQREDGIVEREQPVGAQAQFRA